MIDRILLCEFKRLLQSFSVVILTGPRQSGKTTLCQMLQDGYSYVNLENVAVREMIAGSPMDFLREKGDKLIIDEAQRLPDLFSYIQVVVDEHPERRIILTGSNNFTLMERITQSLAGRAALLTLLPLSLSELGGANDCTTDEILFRGGFPAVWGAGKEPYDVYGNYYATYVERDLRQVAEIRNLSQFEHFMRLLAGRVGSEVNASRYAAEIGVSSNTIQQWLSVLEASYIVFRLPPYSRNIGKRIVRANKLYFYDTGLACFLLGIQHPDHIRQHPLRGELFENMVVTEFLKKSFNNGRRPNLFFYRDNQQKEVDVIEETSYHSINAYEIKSARIYNGSFGAGLNYLHKLFGDEVKQSQVIYDGDEELVSDRIGYRNVRSFFSKNPSQ